MELRQHVLLLSLFFSLAALGDLVPARAGGNPSFEIAVGFTADFVNDPGDRQCQATLVQRTPARGGWRCSLVTAAHCMEGQSSAGQVPRFIRTADFGTIRDFEVYSKGNHRQRLEEDIAVVHFYTGCESSAEKLIVPIGSMPESATTPEGMPVEVFHASRTFKRLFWGDLAPRYQPEKKIFRVNMGQGLVGGQVRTFGSFTGDSGGGVFLRNPHSGGLELIGILSHGLFRERLSPAELPDRGASESIYVTDIPWIQKQLMQVIEPISAGLNFGF